MPISKMSVHRSEYDRAEWPETSQVHVSAPNADGDVIVTEITGDRPSWVESCTYCQGEKPGGFYPPHYASSRCQSGGRNHCSCDTCF